MHSGHRKRLRQRLRDAGADSFADHELLELLLCYAIPQKDVNPLAHQLIDHFGSLHAVFSAEYKELEIVPDMGEVSATLIVLCKALITRLQLRRVGRQPVLKTLRLAGSYAASLLQYRKNEAFYVLLLNAQHRLIQAVLISEGTPNESAVHPRSIAQAALLHGATFLILAHNHPSGNSKPSSADLRITELITDALAALDIRVEEHLIVTNESIYAIKANRTFPLTDRSPVEKVRADNVYNPHELAALLKALDSEEINIVLRELDSAD